METENLITVSEFCTHYNIEVSFVDALHEFGFIEIIIVEEQKYIEAERITEIEKIMRLHYGLEINLEGIDVISRLLHRIEELEQELVRSKNRLRLYE